VNDHPAIGERAIAGRARIESMEVRLARREEADAVATVWLRSRAASVPAIPPPVHSDDEVREWFQHVVLPAKEVWVADEDGSIRGVLVLDDAGIDQRYVDPDHTSGGIGGELLSAAKRRRSDGLTLWTFAANVGARRFYERHGFTVIAETDGDNEEGAPDVRYAWWPLDRQPTLESPLLRLRPLHPQDFDDLCSIASDPLLWEQHPSTDRATRPGFERWFEAALASGGALVAIDRADEQIIGTSRFDRYDDAHREVEIGWTFVARRLWGGFHNGEMKRLMLQHAFRSVDTVLFRVHSLNLRSQRAVEKLGAVRVRTEADPHGRGENVVFRLTAPSAE